MAEDSAGSRYCPYFHRAIELVGRRWTGAILHSMLNGTTHFGDIRDSVPGLSDRLLTERLKELNEAGVVERCTATRDIHYHLTEVGRQIEPVLASVENWSRQLANVAAPPPE